MELEWNFISYISAQLYMENMKQSCAVSFDIILDETAVKPEPERMALMKNRRKTPITAQEIEKRQKLAEQRRQVRVKAINCTSKHKLETFSDSKNNYVFNTTITYIACK